MSSREALRQELGEDLSSMVQGTADSGSTTTLVDADLIDSLEENEQLEGAWVWMQDDTAGTTMVERRVRTYDPASGTLTFSRPFTDARASGMSYEIHKRLKPSQINTVINRTLARLAYVVTEDITVVSGQRNYSLSALTAFTQAKQAMRVLWRHGDTADEYSYQPITWWEVMDRGGTFYLDVFPYTTVGGSIMVFQYWRTYDTLATDAATTECPAEWVKAGAMLRIYDRELQYGASIDHRRNTRLRAMAAAHFHSLSTRLTPRPPMLIHLPSNARHGLNTNVVV